MEISTGFIVKLKSGGPTMVVKNIDMDRVICNWFNFDDALQEGEFSPYQLKIIEEATEVIQNETAENTPDSVQKRGVRQSKGKAKGSR